VIDPERLGGNMLPPPVQIEPGARQSDVLTAAEGLRLPPNTRDLQIDYTGLSFVVPRKTRFRYRLEGHDIEWQDVGTRRQAFYTDLPPRNYVFRVTGRATTTASGTKTGASLAFSITPTFSRLVCSGYSVLSPCSARCGCCTYCESDRSRGACVCEPRNASWSESALLVSCTITLLQGLLSASLQLPWRTARSAGCAGQAVIERILQLLRQAIDEGREAVRGLALRLMRSSARSRRFPMTLG